VATEWLEGCTKEGQTGWCACEPTEVQLNFVAFTRVHDDIFLDLDLKHLGERLIVVEVVSVGNEGLNKEEGMLEAESSCLKNRRYRSV
jgi:hypothetical protein